MRHALVFVAAIAASCEKSTPPAALVVEMQISGSSCSAELSYLGPTREIRLPWQSEAIRHTTGRPFEATVRVLAECADEPSAIQCAYRTNGGPWEPVPVLLDTDRQNGVNGVQCRFHPNDRYARTNGLSAEELAAWRSERRVAAVRIEAPDAGAERIAELWRATSASSSNDLSEMATINRIRALLQREAANRPEVARAIRAEELRGR